MNMQNFTNFNQNSKELSRKHHTSFYQNLTRRNITKRFKKTSRTHEKNYGVLWHKNKHAGVYVAVFYSKNAGTGGCE
jgi:hypothetical protein